MQKERHFELTGVGTGMKSLSVVGGEQQFG